jgi:hypothetical protein
MWIMREKPVAASKPQTLKCSPSSLLLGVLLIAVAALPAAAQKVLDPDRAKGNGIPLDPFDCAMGNLDTGDATFDTGEFYQEYVLNWAGGDLNVVVGSEQFNAYVVAYEPPGFPSGNQVDINNPDNPEAFETYFRAGAPPGTYSFLVTTSVPGERGDFSICTLPRLETAEQDECYERELTFADTSFPGGSYFDTYYLDWPGGDLEISLDSSDFDEYLIVYPPPGQGVSDPIVIDLSSSAPEVYSDPNTEPGLYLVRVTSFETGVTGDYTLCISQGCAAPSAPANPSPANEAQMVGLSPTLSWSPGKVNRDKVIYGEDDRMEIFEVMDPRLVEAFESTAVVVDPDDLVNNGDGTYSLTAQSFNEVVIDSGMPALCSDEPYRDQPSPGTDSGFLVAPDLLVTAGHTLQDSFDCDHAFVFGFKMLDANTPKLTFPVEDVYFCQQVVARNMDGFEDFSVIRLDRPVVGRSPLPIRHSGVIPDNAPLVVLNYPYGLPGKISDGGNVRENSRPQYFTGNLDVYGGSSGAPVLNMNTLVVEGIINGGEPDFVQDGDCTRSKVCADDGCQGERVMRTTTFSNLIEPVIEYEVHLGTPGNAMFLGTTEGFEWQAGPLMGDTEYEWWVIARKGCGETMSPVWSFRTVAGGGNHEPIETYDTEPNGTIDARDLLALLEQGPLPRSLFNFSDYWEQDYEP